jgi:hypothetical protein
MEHQILQQVSKASNLPAHHTLTVSTSFHNNQRDILKHNKPEYKLFFKQLVTNWRRLQFSLRKTKPIQAVSVSSTNVNKVSSQSSKLLG